MAEYIERDCLIDMIAERNRNTCNGKMSCIQMKRMVESIPAADVVSRCAYNQAAWERDQAIKQLREDYGVGLGEKKSADVAPVRHGKWIGKPISGFATVRCSVYRETFSENSGRWKFCPNCGAKMDLEG